MDEVLFVSKPVHPPWNDSSKNLVRDIARNLERHSPVLMGRIGEANPLNAGRVVEVYGRDRSRTFSPSVRDNASALRHLLWAPRSDVWHFFFAPNQKSSTASRFARAVRRVPSVHTVCSTPAEESSWRSLVFADVTVALSRYAHDRLRAEGLERERLRLVPPSVPQMGEPTPAERSSLRAKHELPTGTPIWIYPGDLEFGEGAKVSLDAFAAWNRKDATLLMACRNKTAGAERALACLRARARGLGIADRVLWLGETPFIHEMLALSDFVVLPNRSPFAKMDYPLVALEALAMGRPLLVGMNTPAAELAEDGAAVASESEADALAAAIEDLSTDERRRETLRTRARSLIAERFDPRAVAGAYERIYEEIRA